MKFIKVKVAIIYLMAMLSSLSAATSETIVFIGDDLETGLSYKNMRYDSFGEKGMLFGENYNRNNLSYIKPDGYRWEKYNYQGTNAEKLVFNNTNNYAFLQRLNLKNDIELSKVKDNTNEWFMIIDGGHCIGDNCIQNENIISVVLPKRFKILHYESFEKQTDKYNYNPNGNFKIIDNTITLYAKNIQGAVMKLWVQDLTSTSEIYKDIFTSFEKFSEISVYKTDTETKIVMPMDNVFASGKAEANQIGKDWLKLLSSTLQNKNYKEIRVEGHTDNIPIKGTYPSNWELSSARASSAVRFMIDNGIDSNKILAIGYADTKPLIDNNSNQNRAKNRRVEIVIVGNSDKE